MDLSEPHSEGTHGVLASQEGRAELNGPGVSSCRYGGGAHCSWVPVWLPIGFRLSPSNSALPALYFWVDPCAETGPPLLSALAINAQYLWWHAGAGRCPETQRWGRGQGWRPQPRGPDRLLLPLSPLRSWNLGRPQNHA